MFAILALVMILAIPALVAYVVSLFTYKRVVKSGNGNPRRVRIAVFIVGYVLLFSAEVIWLLNSLSFER